MNKYSVFFTINNSRSTNNVLLTHDFNEKCIRIEVELHGPLCFDPIKPAFDKRLTAMDIDL